ncbi:MAG: DUF1924 domain-containing protein, partial [Gammaproteobacteria bacterium]|nr:DUF1924 domain-containing protein [Gammaproteobacteria bacterium]
MKTLTVCCVLLLCLSSAVTQADNGTVNDLLQNYTSQGVMTVDKKQGELTWQKVFRFDGEFSERSCASCHTKDLTSAGKHIKTGKLIKPMAISSNAERLTDSKKVEKWFKRNCLWTMGRECN